MIMVLLTETTTSNATTVRYHLYRRQHHHHHIIIVFVVVVVVVVVVITIPNSKTDGRLPPILYNGRKCHVRVDALLTCTGEAYIHRKACFFTRCQVRLEESTFIQLEASPDQLEASPDQLEGTHIQLGG
jgi:hypothetical protein